jgi:hypothetical protein
MSHEEISGLFQPAGNRLSPVPAGVFTFFERKIQPGNQKNA